MSIGISATWSGGKPPLTQFQFLKAAKEWSDEVGPKLRTAIKDETPVKSGRMKKSERYERKVGSDSVRMSLSAHVPYAPYVIRGAKPHIIRPVAAQALHWVGPKGSVFAKVVHHPGNRANDFPKRVLADMRQEITDNLKNRLQDMIK